MKIFNKENGIEKIYVQKKDIIALDNFGIEKPIEIGKKSLDNIDMEDFVEFVSISDEGFDSSPEIEFFKNQDWIIDYKKIRAYPQGVLETMLKEKEYDMQLVLEQLEETTLEYANLRESLQRKYSILRFQYEDIKKVYSIKQFKDSLNFPLVPDFNGFSIDSDNPSNQFKLCATLDPNKYLLFKKDGTELKEDETIPINFVQGGLCVAFMNRIDSLPSNGGCTMNYYLTEDHKQLVIETKIIETKEEIRETQKEVPKVKGIRKIFNKLFSKNN